MKPFKELTIAEAEDAWNNALQNHINLQDSMHRIMDLLDSTVRDGKSDVNVVKIWLAIIGNKLDDRKKYVMAVTGYSEEELEALGGFDD